MERPRNSPRGMRSNSCLSWKVTMLVSGDTAASPTPEYTQGAGREALQRVRGRGEEEELLSPKNAAFICCPAPLGPAVFSLTVTLALTVAAKHS